MALSLSFVSRSPQGSDVDVDVPQLVVRITEDGGNPWTATEATMTTDVPVTGVCWESGHGDVPNGSYAVVHDIRLLTDVPLEYNTTYSFSLYVAGSHPTQGTGSITTETFQFTTKTDGGGGGAPSKATTPTPANASGPGIDFSDVTLSWVDGGGATSYRLYLGTQSGVLSFITQQAETSWADTLSRFISDTGYVWYWRIDSVNDTGTTTGDEWSFDPRPAKATNPSPADTASDQSINLATLSWDACDEADWYDVYCSVTPLAVGLKVTDLFDSIAGFTPLDYATVYTWRIDSENQFGTTEGDEWTFTTLTFEPPIVSARYKADDTTVPLGTAFDSDTMYFTGDNFQAVVSRLVAAAADALWYEVPG